MKSSVLRGGIQHHRGSILGCSVTDMRSKLLEAKERRSNLQLISTMEVRIPSLLRYSSPTDSLTDDTSTGGGGGCSSSCREKAEVIREKEEYDPRSQVH